MAVCASPKLFAAYHVFHRLLVPRHSPCALSCLTSHNTLYCFSENIAFSLECFVVAIQLLLHLKIENFVFSIDSIFALLVFSFQGASCFEGLILQNRTMNIFHNLALKNVYEKSFVMLRITHVFAPQTRLKIPRCILQAVCAAKF